MMKRDEERLWKIYEMRNRFEMHKKERELRMEIEEEEMQRLWHRDYSHQKLEQKFYEN